MERIEYLNYSAVIKQALAIRETSSATGEACPTFTEAWKLAIRQMAGGNTPLRVLRSVKNQRRLLQVWDGIDLKKPVERQIAIRFLIKNAEPFVRLMASQCKPTKP